MVGEVEAVWEDATASYWPENIKLDHVTSAEPTASDSDSRPHRGPDNEGAAEAELEESVDRASGQCCGWKRVEQGRGIVESKYFNRGIMIAILINTVSMGIEHHQQPVQLTNVLEICNIVFTSMFSLEMILKVTAFGSFNYLRNPYNVFDGTIVIISVCEIVGQSDGGLSVLRTFRLLRVLKLVRFMPALRSILGMHIFGCKFSLRTETGDTVPDRKNFDSLLWAIVTVFQILTQEDWNTVLYNGMAATSPLAALYFVALMTFGNYVLFNLLVAILVEGFQAEDRVDDDHSSLDESEKQKDSLKLSDPKICTLTPNGNLEMPPPADCSNPPSLVLGSCKSSDMSLGRSSLDRRSLSLRYGRSSVYHNWGRPLPPQSAWSRRSSCNSLSRRSGAPLVGGSLRVRSSRSPCSAEQEALLSRSRPAVLPLASLPPPPPLARCYGVGGDHHALSLDLPEELKAHNDRADLDEEIDYGMCFRIRKMAEEYKPDWCENRQDWSVFLFSPQNKFRLLCRSIIAHKLFDYVVLAFIFLNCITVALERPRILQGSLERLFLTVSNYVFTAIFVTEMTVKRAYLHSSWNILDGFLVLVSLLDIVVSMAGGAKILGVLRLVVETLITSLKPIGNIVLICCAFFIIFGILGVQLFKGKFYYCLGLDVRNITNKSDCLSASNRWVHHKYNFDNLGQALMALFVLASKDGWVNIMYHGLDAVGIDQQPVINHSPWMLLYFISFLLIVSFFVLNMFVGVVVENFHKCRQHQEVEEAKRRQEKRQRRMEKKRRTSLRWNQLDLAIVLLSVMGITLEEIELNAALPINPTIIRIMRVLRIARVCNADYPCEGMSRHATFENFGMAFLTLFQVSTGDNWNGIMKDTLRECPPGQQSGDYGCHTGLQFISPLYFVSFVLTAQFVLINVVVAVLMKHLDDSNKEAQEDGMVGEVPLPVGAGGGLVVLRGGECGGIKDSLEGDLIDNLSGSVFHHYCRVHSQEIRLAEVEGMSLTSEQTSDKSSLALPDDLSLDEHSMYQPLPGQQRGEGRSPPLLHDHPRMLRYSMVTCMKDFFHRATTAPPGSTPLDDHQSGRRDRSRLTHHLHRASWTSLRSPGAHGRDLCSQALLILMIVYFSSSSSSSCPSPSPWSPQHTSSSPSHASIARATHPAPRIRLPSHASGPHGLLLTPQEEALHLLTTRGQQRGPGGPPQDLMDLSEKEESGRGRDVLSSLSLTSLLSPGSLAVPVLKKCNSTGSLHRANQDGFVSDPWELPCRGEMQDGGFSAANNRSGDGQLANTSPRKNR
ncbi:hypothetical protein NHX12_018519 [Muraenolepis orangiensis]|uniref:Ion transport domain-containing protein n=1 Tax=Muraenolepis orangiensis TaxID=630683 RepID=A0A9Q0IY30_9TELE|nr:hypothetical protein NHX12_018519 [Muraenolepis orangiensis]